MIRHLKGELQHLIHHTHIQGRTSHQTCTSKYFTTKSAKTELVWVKKYYRSWIRTQALEITKQVSLVLVYRSVGHKGVKLSHK